MAFGWKKQYKKNKTNPVTIANVEKAAGFHFPKTMVFHRLFFFCKKN